MVILTSIVNWDLRISRCNSDKAHFNQIIKSKARMNRMNRIFILDRKDGNMEEKKEHKKPAMTSTK